MRPPPDQHLVSVAVIGLSGHRETVTAVLDTGFDGLKCLEDITMAIAHERLTDEQLMSLPKDGFKHEYVDGEVTSMPTHGDHDQIILALAFRLYPILASLGAMSCGQSGFRMASGNIRVPDFSFMPKERLPGGKASRGFADGAPDFCVEVISPSERRGDIRRKIGEYFESGARIVWLIEPESLRVIEYRAENVESHTFTSGDELTLNGVVDGFRYTVDDLFSVL